MSAPENSNAAPQSNNDGQQHPETIQERSARLEREAQELYKAQSEDPLAPTSEVAPEQPASPPAEAPNGPAIEALQNELATAKDQLMRALAEAENTRRRAAKEREDAKKFAITSFAREMIDVADNLRRALDAAPTELAETEPRLGNLLQGIEATERSMLRALEAQGIKKIVPGDEIFNPNLHEVMYEAPVPGKQAGAIIEVIENGYMIHERLLRPARVGVAKDMGEASSAPQEQRPGGNIDTEA